LSVGFLHTWGQQLTFHPHAHCIVSGVGADKQNRWHNLKKSLRYGYLFPYKVMEPIFKGYFLKSMDKMIRKGKVNVAESCNWKQLRDDLYKKEWLVYAKQPMGNAGQVVEYLARYSHKVAISNYRIIEVTENSVRFRYKDYADGKKTKTMSLSHEEFLRRFEQHFRPKGFVKMRHYRILGNNQKKQRINAILNVMNLPPHPPAVKISAQLRMMEKYGVDVTLCPRCKKGRLMIVAVVLPMNRGSPVTVSNDQVHEPIQS
jgi:hypothetical protein